MLDDFYREFEIKNYKKGQVIIRSDSDPFGFFCLKTGYVRQFSISETGMELTLRILKPSSFFPIVWAIGNLQNNYSYEALTEIEVLVAPTKAVHELLKNKQSAAYYLLEELAVEYEEALTRIGHLVFSDAYRRVISIFIYLANNFGEVSDGRTIVRHHFTHQNIASLVGVARETASVEIKKLEDKGFFAYVNHEIVYSDLLLLESELTSISQ